MYQLDSLHTRKFTEVENLNIISTTYHVSSHKHSSHINVNFFFIKIENLQSVEKYVQ